MRLLKGIDDVHLSLAGLLRIQVTVISKQKMNNENH